MAALVFATQPAAVAAVATIDVYLAYPSAVQKTQTWAVPRQMKDGRWAIADPGPSALAGVTGYTSVAEPTWPDLVGAP